MSTERGSRGDLFGRGMIYVVVWSMQMVVATVVSPVLAHVLPVAAFGSLAAAIALYQLLLIVIVFGLDQALAVQRVEDVDDDQRARGLVASGLVASIVVTGLAAATSTWWGPALGFTSQHLLLLTLGWTLPGSAVLLVLSLLQAEDRLRRFSVVSLISTVGSQLVGISLLFIVGRTAETYAIGGVVGQCTALALVLFWVRPRLRGLLDLESVKRALQLGMPLVLTSLAEYVLTAGDRFLIQRWLGAVQVARYQVAFTVGNVVTLLLTFTNRAWLPRLKSIADPDERWKVIGASRDGVYVLAGWAAFGITIAAPALLRVFAPESYGLDSLLAVVAVVGLGALPVAASVASGQQLVTIRWSSPLAWGAAAAVAVKVVATVGLLPVWGIDGAAVGTLLALLAQAVVLRFAVASRHGVAHSRPRVLVFIGLVVVGSLGSVWLPQTLTWNIVRFSVAAVCVVPFWLSLRRLQRG
jgi:O-antigen/teichoic acid export membrane protein